MCKSMAATFINRVVNFFFFIINFHHSDASDGRRWVWWVLPWAVGGKGLLAGGGIF